MSYVAAAFSNQKEYAKAEKMHRETLRLYKKVLGEEHPNTLTSMSHVAAALSDQGEYVEAEKMHRETLRLYKKVLGDEHPHTLMSMYSLAHLLGMQLRFNDSRSLYEQVNAAYDTVLGEDHPTTRACYQHYLKMLASQEQDRISLSRGGPESSVGTRTSKRSRIVRGLAKVGIRTLKPHID